MEGQLQAADISDRNPYGIVQLHGGDSTWTDDTGHFTLTAPNGLHRIVLTASDSSGYYVKTTKVIYPSVMSGITYTLITMFPKAPSVSYMASEKMVLTMGGKENDAFVGINIPPHSVFSEDGFLYTGEVRASLTVIDPRNMTDIINAPGSLTFVDEEGEVQPLKTFGMFNLQLADPADKPLQTQGDIEFILNLAVLGHNMQDIDDNLPKLSVLDTSTGQWVKIADMRKEQGSFRHKRQASTVVVGNTSVPISGTWIHYYQLDLGDVCFSNIFLYETNQFLKKNAYAEPYILVRNGTKGPYQGYNTKHGSRFGGYCITHPCDVNSTTNYKGYVYVVYKGLRTIPVNESGVQGIKSVMGRINYESLGNAVSVDFSYLKQQSKNGPFYQYTSNKDLHRCREADDKQNHFRFYALEKAICTQSNDAQPKALFPDANIDDNNPKANNPNFYAWYTTDDDNRYAVIYIKIKTNSSRNVLFQAQSNVGNSIRGSNATEGDPYGESSGCAKDNEPICLEVKPSGKVFANPGNAVGFDETQLVVQTLKDQSRGTCSGYIIHEALAKTIRESTRLVQSHKFKMKFTTEYMESGISYKEGVYHLQGDSNDSPQEVEKLRKRVLRSCEAGCRPGTCQKQEPSEDFSALKFLCK